jgi:hypothetical protein
MNSVLIAADDALKSAAEAGDRTTEEVDKKFEDVIYMLIGLDFGSYLISDQTKATRKAMMKDKSQVASMILHTLKTNLHAKVKSPSAVSLLPNIDES